MPQHYDETLKKQIVRLRLEECQNNPESQNEYDSMKEIRKLRKEMEELRKENLFLKKAAAFFAKEID